MPKILLVEDDHALVKLMCDCLGAQQHTVEFSYNGAEGLDLLRSYQFELIILDWDLPGLSGIEVCRQYRARGGMTPVLMLTGKSTVGDKEAGLDAGADDYLTKPFSMRELAARVRALLRRPGGLAESVLRCRHIELEPDARKVMKNGAEIKLLPREFALLEFMMRHPGQVFTTQALLDRVWPLGSDATAEAVTSCIKRLRTKLDKEGEPSVITSVYGVGYKVDRD